MQPNYEKLDYRTPPYYENIYTDEIFDLYGVKMNKKNLPIPPKVSLNVFYTTKLGRFAQLMRRSISVEHDDVHAAIHQVVGELFNRFPNRPIGVLKAYDALKQMAEKGSFVTHVVIHHDNATFYRMFQENKPQMMIHFDVSCGKFDLHFYDYEKE